MHLYQQQEKELPLVSDIPENERGLGVGIDLGTTNSAVAILSEDGIPKIIHVPHNGPTIPSVVSYSSSIGDELEIHVGAAAIEREMEDVGCDDATTCCYRNVKRVMGMGGSIAAMSVDVVPNLLIRTAKERRKGRSRNKKKSSPQPTLAQQLEEAEASPARLSCPALSNPESDEIPTIAPEEISSHILHHLFQTAQDYYESNLTGDDNTSKNCRITRAVVGVPAYFNDAQRTATIRACEMAGVEKVRLLREPEAAALAYGIGREQALEQQTKQPKKKQKKPTIVEEELVLVFDLGGGTFDVSILTVCDGLMEVIATSGNNMLGGSDFDARIAEFLSKNSGGKNFWKEGGEVADTMVQCAETIRIYLSNNKVASLQIPTTEQGWLQLKHPTDILIQTDHDHDAADIDTDDTHVTVSFSRKQMEQLCTEEFQALLRPVREVAIMGGALLPGDASPSAVEAILQMEEELEEENLAKLEFDSFFDETSGTAKEQSTDDEISDEMVLQLKALDLKQQKKAQQRGRKRARNLAKDERKFREQKKVAAEQALFTSTNTQNVKVRDGINGRKISQVVLVGGATRMPAIGRLLASVTGVVPQRTVNPDEAVALGCAVQVGILDGDQGRGLQVLSPIEAAMLRALAKKRGLDVDDDDDDDFDEFDEEIFY